MRRHLALAACAVAAEWTPAAAPFLPTLARALAIPTRLRSVRGVLLSFDDGPDPEGTPAVLAQLRHAGAPGLFFVSGEQAARYPDLVRDVVADGHEVAVHGFRHQTRRQWPSSVFAADTRRAIEVLASLGVEPRFYRPPHGAFTFSALRSVRILGLTPLLWSRWGRDWERRATAPTIASRATAALRAGDVLLLHDADHYGASGSWRRTAEALPEICSRIEAAGLEPASVGPGRGSRAPALTA